jgi:hypothetical protein
MRLRLAAAPPENVQGRELGGYFARNYFGSMTLSPLI